MRDYCANILPKRFIFPDEAKITKNWFKAAYEHSQSSSCIEARVYSLGCLVMGTSASTANAFLYGARSIFQPVVHLINLDTTKSYEAFISDVQAIGMSLYTDVQAIGMSLYTTALGIISAVSTIFYPAITKTLFYPAITNTLFYPQPLAPNELCELIIQKQQEIHQALEQLTSQAENEAQLLRECSEN